MAAFLGMRGTGDWATDQRPKNWREMILLLYPNGKATLTAMTSKLASEKVDDPEFNWWTKTLSRQGGAVTDVYIDSPMSEAYVYADDQATYGVSGAVVYAKVAEATADHFRAGHMVVLRDADRLDVDVRGKVVSVDKNGASSKIGVKLLEADDNDDTSSSYNLSTVDTILVIGDMNAEGAEIPDALGYDPSKVYNYTQIFRQALEISRTAMMTRLRTGDAYQELKRETLEYHSVQMEKAFLDGIRYEGTGSNAKKERSTQGVITSIKENNSAAVSHYPDATGYTTKTWKTGGKDWLDEQLEVLFRYGDMEKMCFIGSQALLGINQLAETYGNIQLQAATESYGIKVLKWVTPFGEVNLKTHPLFTHETTRRRAALFFEPRRLKYRFITDTTFYPDPNRDKKLSGHGKIDGIKEEYLTEAGLEFHHFETGAFYTGLGSDGTSA